MFRKSSGTYRRRSSQPKRLSAALLETANENKKPEMKKSMIPMPRGSNRASSAEDVHELGRPSSLDRESTAKRRAHSTERLTLSGNAAVTPKLKGLTPGSVITTTRRTARRDTRVLTDRAFQSSELCRVREYLVSEGLLELSEVDDIGSKMTLKLFAKVMRVLLDQFFPGIDINVSNYVEVLPGLLKKLKYPGKVARSWLVTVNATHCWPHVLGVMSWLVNLLTLSEMTWKGDEDDLLDSDQIGKMHAFNAIRFREWTFGETDAVNDEDERFFQDLMGGRIMYLREKEKDLRQVVEELEKRVNDSYVLANFANAQQKKDTLKQLEVDNEDENRRDQKLSLECEELKLVIKSTEKKIQELSDQMRKEGFPVDKMSKEFGSKEALSENIIQVKSEIAHLKHKIECHKTLEEETNNQIYKDDLSIARARQTLDKEQVSREAFLRELGCQHPEAKSLEVSIFYAHPDAPKVMKEYKTYLENTLAAKGEDTVNTNKKLADLRKAVDLLRDELKRIQEEERKAADQVLTAEEHLREAMEAGRREQQQMDRQISETEKVLKQILEDTETENTDIAEKEDILAALVEEVSDLKKDIENTSKVYRENLQVMADKLERHMRKLFDLYEEHMKF